ncbi:MAG TPA: DUF4129 domain-containing protein [Candidatus Acidoferrales bacterium]|nr:DUF4129 domain-containing protein [Candidatus Acidoferrales bacterium]
MNLRVKTGIACISIALWICTHSVAVAASSQSEAGALRTEAATLDAAAARPASTKGPINVAPLAALPAQASAADRSLNAWLRAQLRAIHSEPPKAQQGDLRDLASTLRRLVAPANESSAIPGVAPAAVATRVLAGKDYHVSGTDQPATQRKTLWDRVIEFLQDLFGRIFSGIFSATASNPIIGQIIAALLVALLVVVVCYLAFRIIQALTQRRAPDRVDEGAPLPARADPDLFYRLGAEAANEGRYAQAVALLFQASLAWFDRQGKLTLDPALTPAEYRRAVRRSVERASPYFDKLAQAFVLAAFAERPVSESDWSEADSAYTALRTAASA